MVVPDTELICEIMLVAEGFRSAKHLAKKFITLYSLCKEQLSRQVRVLSAKMQFTSLVFDAHQKSLSFLC